jgi:hypothetical protein
VDAAELKDRTGDDRTGVGRRDEPVDVPIAKRFQPADERRILLLSNRAHRRITHPDDLRAGKNGEATPLALPVLFERRPDEIWISGEEKVDSTFSCGGDPPLDKLARGQIASHNIQ